MKNQVIWIFLFGIVFGGCTPTIKVNTQEAVTEYPTESIVYREEVQAFEPSPPDRIVYNEIPIPEPIPSVEYHNVNYNEVPIPEPVPVLQQGRFNISPLEVFDMLQDNPNAMLLDVRTPEEIPQDGKISGSKLIPLQFLNNRLNQLDKSKQIVVYCHTGSRSVDATKLLRSRGFNAINMSGGIQAWKRSHLAVRWK